MIPAPVIYFVGGIVHTVCAYILFNDYKQLKATAPPKPKTRKRKP